MTDLHGGSKEGRGPFDQAISREKRAKLFREHPRATTPVFLDKVYDVQDKVLTSSRHVPKCNFSKTVGRSKSVAPSSGPSASRFLDKFYNVKFTQVDKKVTGTGHFFRTVADNRMDPTYPFRRQKHFGPRIDMSNFSKSRTPTPGISHDLSLSHHQHHTPSTTFVKQTTREQDLGRSYGACLPTSPVRKQHTLATLHVKYDVVDLNASKCVPFSRLGGRKGVSSLSPTPNQDGDASWMAMDVVTAFNKSKRPLSRCPLWKSHHTLLEGMSPARGGGGQGNVVGSNQHHHEEMENRSSSQALLSPILSASTIIV